MPSATHLADMRDRNPMRLIIDATETLLFGGDRILRIVGVPPGAGDVVVEVLMPESPLRADMLTYAGNLLALSLIIAGVTAVVIYIFAEGLLIAPIKRLTANVLAFRQNPENGTLIIVPDPGRDDEIAVLEDALSETQAELFSMLRQRRHLADLGLAVAKINHDLRNTLTSAQLLSDQVATLDDPKVQRLAPRLVTTLDKAIGFAQSVLDYGRQQSTPPRPQKFSARALGTKTAHSAGLFGHPLIRFDNQLPQDLVLNLDPDHLSRVLVNLLKNAREALEAAGEKVPDPTVTLSADRQADAIRIIVADNGPGLPPRARENLFIAFEGSARAGGTGLGLAIARELVEANGGKLTLLDVPGGAHFSLEFPATSLA
jgi:signal transduction histidine kinase